MTFCYFHPDLSVAVFVHLPDNCTEILTNHYESKTDWSKTQSTTPFLADLLFFSLLLLLPPPLLSLPPSPFPQDCCKMLSTVH